MTRDQDGHQGPRAVRPGAAHVGPAPAGRHAARRDPRARQRAVGLPHATFKRMGGNPLGRSVALPDVREPLLRRPIKLPTAAPTDGAHPPMVSREEFDQAQRILGRPMRPRPQKHEFPFVGLMKCGNCGGSITADSTSRRAGSVRLLPLLAPQAGHPMQGAGDSRRNLEAQFARC